MGILLALRIVGVGYRAFLEKNKKGNDWEYVLDFKLATLVVL